MAATKFRLYKDALRHLADARLAVITDDNESRYALDDAYDQCVEFVLRQAAWRFALKSMSLQSTTGVLPGFAYAYAKPNDWLRTHALYVLTADNRERPLDIREQGSRFFANRSDGIVLRYISRDFLIPERSANPWPEHFAQTVAAYLAFLVADRVTGEHGASGRMSQLFSSLLQSAVEHDAIPEDPWLSYQLDGSFIRIATQVAKQGFWRFALQTLQIDTPDDIGTGGLAHSYVVPDDWLRTRELYVLTADGRHRPFDIREQANTWITNATSFYVQYVSSELVNQSNLWPDPYLEAVQRRLETERAIVGDAKDQTEDFKLSQAVLGDAQHIETLAENPWLQYQLDGSYARCMPVVISRGWWRFSLKTIQLNAEIVGQPGGQDTGFDLVYPYRFPLPDDWVETHALFINWNGTECPFDIKQYGRLWLTAMPVFLARYMSTDAYDSTLWTDSMAKAVQAYLELESSDDPEEAPAGRQGADPATGKAAMFQAALAAALDDESEMTNPWLRHQLSAQFLQCTRWVLEQARWRFAIKSVDLDENSDPLPGDPIALVDDGTSTGTSIVTAPAQHGYAFRFIKPSDWLRTIWFGRQINEGLAGLHIDTDYIDEGLTLHANWSPLSLRYLSTEKGLDPTQWTAHFRDALLAYLEHIEARGNPKLASVAAERFKFFQMQLREAESNDDSRDGPLYRQVGRVVRARYGWGRGYGIGPGYGPSQGWWG